jgi:hypothetical protein
MTTRAVELYATKIFIEGYPKCRQANYRYMLLEGEKEIENFGQTVTVPCFGVEIVREDMVEDHVYSVESDKIECMTIYRYKAVQLLKKLYDNFVSPIHLVDVAGEMADEWTSDFDEALNNIQAQ